MNAINKDVYVRTKIVSHHHLLTEEAFEYFQKPELLIEISDVKENSFLFSCYKSENDTLNDVFYYKCHDIISHFLLAINIATLGHFTWDFRFVSPAPYIFVDEPNKTSRFLFSESAKYINDEDFLQIDKNLIWRTLQLFLALSKEQDRNLKKEYIKGLYNLHNGFFGIEFLNEAFVCFYKSFEFFCTTRILRVKKLRNEKRQLRKVLSDFGFEEPVLKEFDTLYQIRCNLALHAQKGLESVDKGAVVRIKIFLDSVMHKYYQPVWEQMLNTGKK